MQPTTDPVDASGDAPGDVTWMSYAELGRSRGISAASAKRLSNRRRWRKQSGNDGTTRVAVPIAEAVAREIAPGDVSGDVSLFYARALTALEVAVASLTEQLARAEAGRAEERARADRAEQGRDALRDRVEMAEAGRDLADTQAEALRAELERVRAAHGRAVGEADALARDAAERRSRGLLARLRAAVRGE